MGRVGGVGRVLGRQWVRAVLCGALSWCLLPSSTVLAHEHDVLLRLLREGDSFRVRARAAMALGRTGDTSVSPALERALDDQHAAVRAAAAAALGRLVSARSLGALQRASRDPAPDVAEQAALALRAINAARSRDTRGGDVDARDPETTLRSARYAVVLGDMRNDSGLRERELVDLLAQAIAHELRRMGRIAVFAQHEVTAAVVRAIERRKLPVFRLEGNVRRIESTRSGDDHAVRAEVSLLLLDEPGRNMRSMMRGAATGTEGRRGARKEQLRLLAGKALRNAVRSAMSNARAAMKAAAGHGPVHIQGDDIREGPAEASLTRRTRRASDRSARP